MKLEYPTARRFPNLGQVLAMANELVEEERAGYEDIAAFGAPGECCAVVARGARRRYLEFASDLIKRTGFSAMDFYKMAKERCGASYRLDYEWAAGILHVAHTQEEAEEAEQSARCRLRLARLEPRRLP